MPTAPKRRTVNRLQIYVHPQLLAEWDAHVLAETKRSGQRPSVSALLSKALRAEMRRHAKKAEA